MEAVEGATNGRLGWWRRRHDLGQSGAKQASTGEKQGDPQTRWSQLVAMGAGKTLGDAMQAKPPPILRHAASGILGWIGTRHLRQSTECSNSGTR